MDKKSKFIEGTRSISQIQIPDFNAKQNSEFLCIFSFLKFYKRPRGISMRIHVWFEATVDCFNWRHLSSLPFTTFKGTGPATRTLCLISVHHLSLSLSSCVFINMHRVGRRTNTTTDPLFFSLFYFLRWFLQVHTPPPQPPLILYEINRVQQNQTYSVFKFNRQNQILAICKKFEV